MRGGWESDRGGGPSVDGSTSNAFSTRKRPWGRSAASGSESLRLFISEGRKCKRAEETKITQTLSSVKQNRSRLRIQRSER